MMFEKYLLPIIGCASLMFASDPVTLDSMFKINKGLEV